MSINKTSKNPKIYGCYSHDSNLSKITVWKYHSNLIENLASIEILLDDEYNFAVDNSIDDIKLHISSMQR